LISRLTGKPIGFPGPPGRPKRHTPGTLEGPPVAEPSPVTAITPPMTSLGADSVRLLGLPGAARYLGMGRDTVRGLVHRGALKWVRLPGVKRLLLDRRELDRLIDTC
jgi:excisionase family DNA binding protein